MSEPVMENMAPEDVVKLEKEEHIVPDIGVSSISTTEPLSPSGIPRESSATVTSATAATTEREVSPKKELQIDHDRVDPVAMIGGSTTRRYLNEHVTKHLLEGMKLIAREKPEDPLRVLGQFLIDASEMNQKPSS